MAILGVQFLMTVPDFHHFARFLLSMSDLNVPVRTVELGVQDCLNGRFWGVMLKSYHPGLPEWTFLGSYAQVLLLRTA
ncbi:hypothetical protein RRG08_016294 [Elysia crispata]|uniref:Uncharacterized protein n=1 Tax=Elysia crispata TaxID=231223 RepID=A0AAE1B7P3_9GAST|nr:hypothetical protein RRG08_016294 [Elysia crispata]